MTKSEKSARIALVRKIRQNHAKHYRKEYLDIEARVIPCCKTCEFFFRSGKCAGGMPEGVDPLHTYGHLVEDPEDLCESWLASYSAFTKAFARAREQQPEEKPPLARAGRADPERLAQLVTQYRNGEVTAGEAAAALGITKQYFYVKAGELMPAQRNDLTKNPDLPKYIKQFHDGKISAAQAAAELGVAEVTFYKHAKKQTGAQAPAK